MTLEDELPHLLDELANDHAVGLPPALEAADATTPAPRSWRSPILVATAAAACVALLIGGLVVIARRDNNSAVIGQPATSLASKSTLPPTTAISNTPTSVASTQTPSSTTAPASASPRRLSRDGIPQLAWLVDRGSRFATGDGCRWIDRHRDLHP